MTISAFVILDVCDCVCVIHDVIKCLYFDREILYLGHLSVVF